MNLLHDFHAGKLNIFRLNFAILSLIPKEKDATSMKKFSPIGLLNCSFFFTNVLTNRLALLMNILRFILKSVVTAHEELHSIHQTSES